MTNPYAAIERGHPGRIGWRIFYFDRLGSTQQAAGELAARGAAQGTVVIAEAQEAGRGRLGRTWYSPAGKNLYATVILRPNALALSQVASLSLAAGIAVAETLERFAPGEVALKWPNDIWLSRRKAGGLIAEAIVAPDQRLQYVLLGVGLNLNLAENDIPEDLRWRATSVLAATGQRCDRVGVADELFARLETRYREHAKSGFAGLKPTYDRYCALKGKKVSVVAGGQPRSGLVLGVDETGALLLEVGASVDRILAGDVSVESAYEEGV